MLTSFSVTLVTVGQKRGQAAALRDPRVTTPKGEAGLDHAAKAEASDTLLDARTDCQSPAHHCPPLPPHQVATVWASTPWPRPALCL